MISDLISALTEEPLSHSRSQREVPPQERVTKI